MPHLRPRSHYCPLQKNCPAKERSGDGATTPTATADVLRTRRERWFHGSPACILIRNQCPSPISKNSILNSGELSSMAGEQCGAGHAAARHCRGGVRQD